MYPSKDPNDLTLVFDSHNSDTPVVDLANVGDEILEFHFLKSMSKCLLFTGISVSSQRVPPEWLIHFDMYACFTSFSISTIYNYLWREFVASLLRKSVNVTGDAQTHEYSCFFTAVISTD